MPAVFASSPRLLELQCLTICRKFYALSEAVQRSAGPAIMAHHALDNSGCKRLRISSLVCDMSAEQDKYVLFASGSDLVDELRSKGFHTNMWETMLTSAFNEVSAPVDALHTVIGLLRKKLDALQGGPAPAAPSPPAAPPANSAPAVNSVDPAASLPLSLAAPPPPEPADLHQ